MKTKLLIYGMLLLLVLSCTRDTVTDADGNVYRTVRIGNQVWTMDNLRTTKFNDGTPIPQVFDSTAWHFLTTSAYCYYGNMSNVDSIKRFGALYNWYCVDSKKLAPRGWHVPTNDDWTTLQNYLIDHGYNWDRERSGNRIAKALAATDGWKPFTVEGMPGNAPSENNRSGFTGIGAGYRYDTKDSVTGNVPWSMYTAVHHKGAWWSATPVNELQASAFGMGFCVEKLIQWDMFFKTCGYSIRLVKDKE